MQRDPQRQQILRIAQAWHVRPWEIDDFLALVTHEDFLELAAFEQLHPTGWTSEAIVGGYLAYSIAQSQSTKKLDPEKFALRTKAQAKAAAVTSSPAVERARMEAFAIRQRIESNMAAAAAAARKKQPHGKDDQQPKRGIGRDGRTVR